jgi:hypothetical protein
MIMRRICRNAMCWTGWLLIGAAICPGCAPEQKKNALERYVPATELARHALEAMLVDWKEGLEPGPIDRLAVGVCVVDKQRKKGQTLDEFEILGEAPADKVRCFAVRVKLSGPEAEEKVRFVVIGIDPLWVFRQEDFESLGQWSCGKQEEPVQPTAESAQPVGEGHAQHESITEGATEESTETSESLPAADDKGTSGEATIPPTAELDETTGKSGESVPRQDE